MMMLSSSLVAINGNEAVSTLGSNVNVGASNTANALAPVAHGSNSNIGSSLSIAAAAVAAAAAAPVGFNLDSPEDMDFEAMREKRSRTQAADDEVQDHKVVVTNYESDYENL